MADEKTDNIDGPEFIRERHIPIQYVDFIAVAGKTNGMVTLNLGALDHSGGRDGRLSVEVGPRLRMSIEFARELARVLQDISGDGAPVEGEQEEQRENDVFS